MAPGSEIVLSGTMSFEGEAKLVPYNSTRWASGQRIKVDAQRIAVRVMSDWQDAEDFHEAVKKGFTSPVSFGIVSSGVGPWRPVLVASCDGRVWELGDVRGGIAESLHSPGVWSKVARAKAYAYSSGIGLGREGLTRKDWDGLMDGADLIELSTLGMTDDEFLGMMDGVDTAMEKRMYITTVYLLLKKKGAKDEGKRRNKG